VGHADHGLAEDDMAIVAEMAAACGVALPQADVTGRSAARSSRAASSSINTDGSVAFPQIAALRHRVKPRKLAWT